VVTSISRGGEVLFPQPVPVGQTQAPSDSLAFTVSAEGQREVLVRRSGSYTVRLANGEVRNWNAVRVRESHPIEGSWTLTFPPDSGVGRALTLDTLRSWSRHPDPDVQHFSGTAKYRTVFTLPEIVSRIVLDLGRVEVMAKVTVNGREYGPLWKAPYHVDITDAVRAGDNTLEVAVVNLWVNRLIGDAALPEDAERDANGALQRWPDWVLAGGSSPVGRRTFVTQPLWRKNEPLKDSGLLGPVVLHFPVAFRLEPGATAARRMAGAGGPTDP
jgi:hypothetical protein